jgi:gliding motility-associated-like protein
LVIDAISGSVDLMTSTPGIYMVTNSIIASGGCASALDSSAITINALDNAGFSYSSASYCQTPVNQIPVITGASGGTFTSAPVGLSMNTSTGEINPSASVTGAYIITYTTAGACINSGSATVNINSLPVANAGADLQMDCGAALISLDGSGSASGTGVSYSWTGGSILSGNTTAIPSVNQTGSYIIAVNDNNGCTSVDTVIVSASSIVPIASFSTTPVSTTGTTPMEIDFLNTSQNANTYSWNFGDGSALNSSDSTNYIYTTPGTYTVVLTCSNNGMCSDTATVIMIVKAPVIADDEFSIPEGFSPNGDAVNDLFVIKGISKYPDNKFVVFNRWGNKVYETSPYINEWDGKTSKGLRIGGDDLPVGTYFYILDLGDGTDVIKGNIYLNK